MKIIKLGTMVAAASIATAAVALPADAHPAPFTVTAGSAAAGATVGFTATSSGVTIRDTTTGFTFNCASLTLKGSVKTGSRATGAKLGVVNGAGAGFQGCTAFAGQGFTLTGVGTWYLDVSDSANGIAVSKLSNVVINVKTRAGAACSFTLGSNSGSLIGAVVPGTYPAAYNNGTKTLSVPATNPGGFGMWNVHGSGSNTYCISKQLLNQGDKLSISTNLSVKADSAANNPISIT